MLLFLLAFAASTVTTLVLIRSARVHEWFSADSDLSGPQKVHVRPVPRVGGVGIAVGLIAGVLGWLYLHEAGESRLGVLLLVCGIPAFAGGLFEDISKRVEPRYRLVATALSALMAVIAVDATIGRTDLWGLDWVASSAVGAAVLAVFVVAGIANSINIIDGFNGLASMCVVMMLLAITYVAGKVGDVTIATLALMGAGAVLGFFIWNYPSGMIFLGDGGAYFLGFYVAELGILLLARNPGVSPLFPLLMCIYPVFETVFSMYRRKFVRGHAMAKADGVHLHSLIYRRLLRWVVGVHDAKHLTRRNSMTAPYCWLLCLLAIVPSILWWDNSHVLGAFIVLFAVCYVMLYGSILRFRSPRWLVIRRR
ncbi:MAG: glycosyl transferase [Methylibium sp.]|nr:glycosyl transferase [Methylibium sp.]MBA3625134.1 glycosyl transferase [Methylibium sp.]